MAENSEITICTSRHKSLLRHVKQKLCDEREGASDRIKKSLLVGANAIQALRMLENLEAVVERKLVDNHNVAHLQAHISEAWQRLTEAIKEADDAIILDVQGRVEQLTLANDPLYLEGTEERKRQYLESKKREIPRPTWTKNPSYRFISLVKGDLDGRKEITEAEQRSCISKCAWGFAILGLIVAISFLIVDFWSAQANPALSTSLFHNEKLAVPTIYGCMTFPMIPSFEGLPNGSYAGNPLWGLRSYSNQETGETYLFPKTKDLITETAYLGPKDVCEEALRYFSLAAITSGLHSAFDPATKCYSCLRIGAKRPIFLSHEKAMKRADGAVTLEFATSRDVEFCFNPLQARNPALRDDIRDVLKMHGDSLMERGIVKIMNNTGLNVDIQFALEFGFEAYSKATPDDDRPRRAAEASVYCNLYLFSGHFFPVKPGTEVRYVYDVEGGLNAWRPVGNLVNFLTIEPVETNLQAGVVNRSTILEDMREPSRAKKLGAIENGVQIYALSSTTRAQPAFKDFAASLRPNHRDSLLFTKKIDGGVSRYSTNLQLGARKMFRAAGRFRRYNISLDFASFETETVTRRPTTSIAEFFTDIFEYIGLFTGVCAYSILVSPARMYLKRSQSQRQ